MMSGMKLCVEQNQTKSNETMLLKQIYQQNDPYKPKTLQKDIK